MKKLYLFSIAAGGIASLLIWFISKIIGENVAMLSAEEAFMPVSIWSLAIFSALYSFLLSRRSGIKPRIVNTAFFIAGYTVTALQRTPRLFFITNSMALVGYVLLFTPLILAALPITAELEDKGRRMLVSMFLAALMLWPYLYRMEDLYPTPLRAHYTSMIVSYAIIFSYTAIVLGLLIIIIQRRYDQLLTGVTKQ